MSSRFSQQASQRQRLFANYDDARQQSQSPSGRRPNGYAHPSYSANPSTPPTGAFGAYPSDGSSFRAATPNSKGQYSDAVLSELESQNDEQMAGLSGKVKRLKDLTMAIGDEIRESTTLADSMNETFDGTTIRLKNTMNRMLRMAERTGIGWRVWLAFFAVVVLLFWYVKLF
ncbi:v-SNARE [Microthyrium microscopicum]|uniref:V-SNARE n=1 Tax=Microthyrium microscopicum TaxID=703497 RepID=A0A6A6U2I3_9PEZI|nr:v-SNARE [Microthyrium microscopicum]